MIPFQKKWPTLLNLSCLESVLHLRLRREFSKAKEPDMGLLLTFLWLILFPLILRMNGQLRFHRPGLDIKICERVLRCVNHRIRRDYP
jgi:hypothetical protein